MYLKHMGGWGYAQPEPFLPCIQWPCIYNLHGFFCTGLGDKNDFGEVEEMDLVANCLLRALLLAKGSG